MSFRHTGFRIAGRAAAAMGVVLTTLLVVGLVLDVLAFDRTRGGHEPPYTGYTGQPIDWSQMDQTATGMVRRGHVVNVLVDCQTGMMTFEVFKAQVPFRRFSPRALAVHKPREGCEARRFAPEF